MSRVKGSLVGSEMLFLPGAEQVPLFRRSSQLQGLGPDVSPVSKAAERRSSAVAQWTSIV